MGRTVYPHGNVLTGISDLLGLWGGGVNLNSQVFEINYNDSGGAPPPLPYAFIISIMFWWSIKDKAQIARESIKTTQSFQGP